MSTGVININGGTATINVPINSTTTVFQAVSVNGGGVLALSAPVNVTASFPLTPGGPLTNPLSVNIIVGRNGTASGPSTLRLLNSSVLPATANVGMGGGGVLDIGANTVTVGGLVFVNQNLGLSYPGQYGVIGAGSLRVTGDINVIGDITQNNFGNAIDSNLDMGGGTQVVRVGNGSSFAGPAALMVTGVISNGSLLKTIGYNSNGALIPASDGLGLFANNTYTGSTTFNGGTNAFGSSMATGTNASTSLKVATSILSIQGANGSYGAATSIQIVSGGSLILDNNASFGTAGFTPVVPAANNNNRISDTAAITLRDGNLTYRGLTGVASSETYGSMNITGGHNTLTIAPTGAGTATFAATGNLTMDPRSTLQIAATSTVLGTTGFVKFGGTVPTPIGANAIIPRVVNNTDFVKYDPTNGFTPLSAGSYAGSYTAGADVSLGAAAATNTIQINAVKTTASLTTTINSGQTLTVNSGMMFATSGTHTVSGGTLDFGSTAGVMIGSHTINSAITGSQGLLASGSGTVTLAGDLSGLSGTVSNIGAGTLTLSGTSANYAGALENRRGTLNINASNAGGAITLGVSANDSNLLPANPGLNISGAGATSTIARDIIVDNGATNAGGVALNRGTLLPTLTALSNTTGSQNNFRQYHAEYQFEPFRFYQCVIHGRHELHGKHLRPGSAARQRRPREPQRQLQQRRRRHRLRHRRRKHRHREFQRHGLGQRTDLHLCRQQHSLWDWLLEPIQSLHWPNHGGCRRVLDLAHDPRPGDFVDHQSGEYAGPRQMRRALFVGGVNVDVAAGGHRNLDWPRHRRW